MNLEKLYNDLSKIEIHKEDDRQKMKNILAEIQTEIINTGKINKGIISNFKKFTKRNDAKTRPIFSQIYKSQNNNYVICNGFALLDFGVDKNNIPLELHSYIDYLVQKYTPQTIDYNRIAPTNTKETVIKISDVEKMIKYNKTLKDENIPFLFENIFINPELLIEMLSIVGFKNTELKVKYDGQHAPITFEHNGVKMMLLPIRHGENEQRYIEINKKVLEK